MKERLAWYKATIEVRSLLRKYRYLFFSFFLTFLAANREKTVFINFSTDATRSFSPLSSKSNLSDAKCFLPGISATLHVQHGSFLSLASKTAAVDAELQKIIALYTQLWRSKTGSVRDPFNENVKRSETPGDFDLSSLTVR